MKRIAVAAAALSIAAVGAFTAPASAEGCPEGTVAQVTVDININGEASPANGTHCLPPAQ